MLCIWWCCEAFLLLLASWKWRSEGPECEFGFGIWMFWTCVSVWICVCVCVYVWKICVWLLVSHNCEQKKANKQDERMLRILEKSPQKQLSNPSKYMNVLFLRVQSFGCCVICVRAFFTKKKKNFSVFIGSFLFCESIGSFADCALVFVCYSSLFSLFSFSISRDRWMAHAPVVVRFHQQIKLAHGNMAFCKHVEMSMPPILNSFSFLRWYPNCVLYPINAQVFDNALYFLFVRRCVFFFLSVRIRCLYIANPLFVIVFRQHSAAASLYSSWACMDIQLSSSSSWFCMCEHVYWTQNLLFYYFASAILYFFLLSSQTWILVWCGRCSSILAYSFVGPRVWCAQSNIHCVLCTKQTFQPTMKSRVWIVDGRVDCMCVCV